MTEHYRFERLSEQNIADLLPLYLDAFHEVRSLENVKAKFDTLQFGAKNIAFIAYDNVSNQAAAFYALFPVTMVKRGRKIIAAQVGDLMTHSKHRRKGLYIRLAEMTHELARKEGIELIFTVPYGDNASYQGFMNRLSFVHTHNLNGYYFKIRTLPLLQLVSKIAAVERVYLALATKILHLFYSAADSFSNTLAVDYAELSREKAFLKYKQKYSKTLVLKIAGVAVWFKIHRGAIKVGDVERLPTSNLGEVISGLKKIAFFLGIRIIQFETSPGTWLDKELQNFSTPLCNYRICILNFSNIGDSDYKFTFADLDNF